MHIDDTSVNDVVDEEMAPIQSSKRVPKWLIEALGDSRLNAPLLVRTRAQSHHASKLFVNDAF